MRRSSEVSWCSRLAAVLAGLALAACIDAPLESSSGFARVVTAWDPLACGEPHRVVVELQDEEGAMQSASAPCNIGGVTLDVSHFGSYRGRVYAWVLGAPIRSVAALELEVDRAIVQCTVATPR